MKRNQSYKGIPSQARKAVRAMLAIQQAAGTPLSPKAAYAHLSAHWKAQEEKKASDEKKTQRKATAKARAYAMAQIKPAFSRLSNVRFFLSKMAEGGAIKGIDTCDEAQFAHALLSQAGEKLERALFALGLPVGYSYENGKNVEGDFVEHLRRK